MYYTYPQNASTTTYYTYENGALKLKIKPFHCLGDMVSYCHERKFDYWIVIEIVDDFYCYAVPFKNGKLAGNKRIFRQDELSKVI